MLHLLKYSFLSKVRNFNIIFWPLVFPLVLGTFFYFAFGNINEADFQTVPVAVVKKDTADTFFLTYLDQVEKSSPDLLKAEEMPEKEALEALLPVLSDETLDFANRDAVFDACKAKAEELGKKNGWLLYPLGIALSGKQRTPGGGTDLACMMGRETTLARVKAAIEKLNG